MTIYTRRKILLLCWLLLYMPFSFAQVSNDSLCNNHCGCQHSLVPAGIMLGHLHNKNEWMISYRYMNMQMEGTNSAHPENIFSTYLMSPDKMRMDMHMVMVMYGISDRLTLMAMGSFNLVKMDMSMFAVSSHHHGGAATTTGENMHEMRSKGPGDTKIHALFGAIKTDHHQLVASFGVNLPTGSINLKGNTEDMLYASQRLPYNMQLGTGTIDLLPGITYLYHQRKLSMGTQVTAAIRPFENKNGYRWGNELNLNTWLACEWWDCLGASARFEGILGSSIQGSDLTLYRYNEPAANAYNYGGKKLNAFAGLYLRAPKGLLENHALALEYGLPLYEDYNGIQMPVTQMINAAWSLTF